MKDFFPQHPELLFLGLFMTIQNKVKLLIDKEIMRTDYIGCHPCENTYSLKLKTKDIRHFPSCNRSRRFEEIDAIKHSLSMFLQRILLAQ